MSTALVVRDGAPAMVREERAALAPMTFEQVVGMGDQLVKTGFLPEHIKTGAQAAAIILTGQELGMAPMRAIRSLQMVKGKVVESADSQLARFKADGGHAVFRRLDEEGAVLFLKHPNGDEHEEAFTADDARAAGLLGKEMYGKFRKAMFRSRAITAGLKSIGWEGGVGNYDPSEALHFAPSVASGAAVEPASHEMTIDEALAMPLPGGAKAWGGKGGTPLGQLGAGLVVRVQKWVSDKIAEVEKEDGEAPPIHYQLRKACDLILEMRRAEVKAKTDAALAPTDTTLAPGKVEDALDKPEPKGPPSLSELAKRMDALLRNEKLSDPERDDFKKRSATVSSAEELQVLLVELEELIASPI